MWAALPLNYLTTGFCLIFTYFSPLISYGSVAMVQKSSLLQSQSRYLSGDFKLKVGCFSTGPPVFGIAGFTLVVITRILISLTTIMAALGTSIIACIMACFMLCSDAILSCFFQEYFIFSAYRLFLLLLTLCNVALIHGR